jgi:hypothetical protein
VVETILNGLLPVAYVILRCWLSGRIGLLSHADASVLARLVIPLHPALRAQAWQQFWNVSAAGALTVVNFPRR